MAVLLLISCLASRDISCMLPTCSAASMSSRPDLLIAASWSNILGSDYVSGARTNYRNSMCPASGYVTARKNCCKPICPAPGKTGGSDCVLYIICPASVDVT